MRRSVISHITAVMVIIFCLLQPVTAADRYSVASGDWSSTATWSAARSGPPGASVPGAADNVFIDNGYEVSIDINAVCNNITVGQGASGILNMGRRTTQPTSQSLMAYGNITVNAGASIIPRRNNQTHTLTVSGNIINNGSMVFSTSTANGPVCNATFNGAGSRTVGGTTPVSFNNLVITPGCSLSLTTGGQSVYGVLLCHGNLSTGGFLTLKSTSVRTALIGGASSGVLTGMVTMERYLPAAYGYKYVSSPFSDATVSMLSEEVDLNSSFPSLYRYSESSSFSGWSPYISPSDPLVPLAGYAANLGASLLPVTVTMTGNVSNGPLSVSLQNSNQPSTKGFSLVGNPYPSPVDWNAPGWTKSNIDNAIWYFRASTTDQYGGYYSSYVNGISSDGAATNIIPSMQGFFIHVSDGTYPVSGLLGVTNSVRVNDLNHAFLKSAGAESKMVIRISAICLNDTTTRDPLAVYYDSEATTGFDSRLDALKMMNTDWMAVNFYSFSEDSQKLSVNAMPSSGDTTAAIALGLITPIDGEVTISLNDISGSLPGTMVLLTDKTEGKITDLTLPGARYAVNLKAGQYDNRFFLGIVGVSTGIEENTAEKSTLFTVQSSGSCFRINIESISDGKGNLDIYSIDGRMRLAEEIHADGQHSFETGLAPGIYIVRYTSGGLSESKKILIGR